MTEVEFYRGPKGNVHFSQPKSGNGSDRYYDLGETDRSGAKSRNGSDKYYDIGETDRSAETEDRSGYILYNGSKHGSNYHVNGEAGTKHNSTANSMSEDTAKDSTSVKSLDSTGKQKSFRRLITRFADKTSMQGVSYISNAKFWWAKLIWSFMLLVAMAAMSLHLWYLVDQYTDWPVQTKISLGFETLQFPEITICNTNVMHKGRLDRYSEASELKDLVEDLQPENLVPDQFDENYDPYATKPPPNNQQGGGSPPTNTGQGNGPGTKPNGPPSQNGSPDSQKPQNRRRRFVEQYDTFNKTRYEEKERPNFRDIEPQKDDDYDGKIDSQTAIQDLFTGMYMDINKNDRAQLGHNITDMLISCTFNGRKCSDNMFTLHQTSDYGNCWSIRSNKFKAKTSGPSGGLSLVFYLEVTEYLKGITTGYGTRVQIHEQSTYPFPSDEGLFIPASMETDIGLRMVSITRQSGLYGDCNDGTSFREATSYKYTRSACQSFCLISKVMEMCKCFDETSEEFAGRKNSQLRPCRSRNEVLCMVNIQKKFENEKLSCECTNPCNEMQYLKSVSQRQWPADDYAMVLLQEICDRDPAVCSSLRLYIDNPAKISNNFLKLNIYYEDLNYENITEIPEIEIQQFLSDVGGAIGLWIGLSILSLCELVQLFVELCDYGVHKTVKDRRQARKKRRKARKKNAYVNTTDFTPKTEKDRHLDHFHPGTETMYDEPYREDDYNHHYPNGRH